MALIAATIGQAFEQQARKYGDRAMLKAKVDKAWRDYSWREVSDAAGRLRAGLISAGIRPGDRIAILAENCPQWVIVDQAVLGLGAVVIPLYTTSGAEETTHVISDSGARIVAALGEDAVAKVLALSRSMPAVEGVIAMHPGAKPHDRVNGSPGVKTLDSMSAGDPAGVAEGRGEDLATIIYTSGTTGPSKGVMLTHGNLLANADSSLDALRLGDQDITLSFLPVAHSFERTAGHYTVMIGGGTIAYAEGLAQIAQNLLEIQPTVLLTVPRLLEVIYSRVMRTVEAGSGVQKTIFNAAVEVGKQAAWYRHRGRPVPVHLAIPMALFRRLVFARVRSAFGERIRYLISGGAPLPGAIFEFLAAAEVPIVEGYGLTEASPVVSVNLHGRTRFGTVGRPLKNIEVKTAPDGELLVRGANVMKGYYRREEETREAIDADGWLHTGDIAQIDAEGFIAITDRKKEIIVLSGGKNVSPANLETRLSSDPYIAQACVIGDRKKHLAALLVPNFENLADYLKKEGLAGKPPEELVADSKFRALYQQRLREFNKSLSDVEAIAAFTLVAQPFSQENGELTPTLKVRRRVVQQHYREQIEGMFPD
jgi:long-chain acyl-CoA synthetase